MSESSDKNNELDKYGVWVKNPPEEQTQDSSIKEDSVDSLPDFTFLDSAAQDIEEEQKAVSGTEEPEVSDLISTAEDTSDDSNNMQIVSETQSDAEDSKSDTEEVDLDSFLDNKAENTSEVGSIPDGEISLDTFLDPDSFDDTPKTTDETEDEAPLDINLTFDGEDNDKKNVGNFEEISLDDINKKPSTSTGTTVDLDNFDDVFASLNGESSEEKSSDESKTENIDLSEFGFDNNDEDIPQQTASAESPKDTENTTDFKMTVVSDDGNQSGVVIPEEFEKEVSSLTENAEVSENMFIQLAQDISSLKEEISSLRNEIEELKKEKSKLSSPKKTSTGFFQDLDSDEPITLSIDEMGDIIDSAEEELSDTAEDKNTDEHVSDEEIEKLSSTDFTEVPEVKEADDFDISHQMPDLESLSSLEPVAEEDTQNDDVEELAPADDDDGPLALDENELGNILNTAQFTTEDAAPLTEENAFDSLTNAETLPDSEPVEVSDESSQDNDVEELAPADDDDEPLALDENELGNILNTAQFTTEDAAPLTEENAFDSLTSAEPIPDSETIETDVEELVPADDVTLESLPFMEEDYSTQEEPVIEEDSAADTQDNLDLPEIDLPSIEDVNFEDSTSVSEELSDEQVSLLSSEVSESAVNFEDSEDEEDIALNSDELGKILNSAQFTTEDADSIHDTILDNISSEESSLENTVNDDIIQDVPEEIDIPSVEDFDLDEAFDTEDNAVAEENDDIPTVESVTSSETGFSEDDLTQEIPTVEQIETSEDSEDETLETGISDEPNENVFNSWGEEASPLSSDDTVEDNLPQKEELQTEPAVVENSNAGVITDSVEEEETDIDTQKEESEDTSIPADMKQEIKSVLSYMDQLLESLPEDKIAEFAKSKQFETYKKLFNELGLSN